MAEPQDHRLDLGWTHTKAGAIITEPAVPGASPIVVGSADGPPDMAAYIARLHNDARHARQRLPVDASAAADAYAQEQWTGSDAAPQARQGFVDGYREGWQEGVQVSREEAENDKKMIASLRAQVEAAYKRAEGMQERLEQWRESSETIKNQRDDETAARQHLEQELGLKAAALDGARAAQGIQENELKRVIAERDAALSELQQCREANRTWQQESSDLLVDVTTYRGLAEQGAKAAANLRDLREKHSELKSEHEDLLDDARIIASLGTSPGAREAAMKRVRARSGAVQDVLHEFEQEVAAGKYNEDPHLVLPELSVNRGGIQFPTPDPEALTDAYDRGAPVHGQGHHTPSYAEGYRLGRLDTSQAFRDPMDQRDQALYAAHLLLSESVAARPETRVPYQRAVRRWQDEYVTVFGTPEEDV